jgi:hypothetical protein
MKLGLEVNIVKVSVVVLHFFGSLGAPLSDRVDQAGDSHLFTTIHREPHRATPNLIRVDNSLSLRLAQPPRENRNSSYWLHLQYTALRVFTVARTAKM